jgi:hypothetical protein
MGHSRPSHFVPVLNNVRYASDSDHSRYESELTLWAKSGCEQVQQPERYSITLSASTMIESGIVRPSALAVLRLITNSNFVGCSTGRSAGFAPLRILST